MNTNMENYFEKFPLSSDLISHLDQSNKLINDLSKILSWLFQKRTQEHSSESEKVTEYPSELKNFIQGGSLTELHTTSEEDITPSSWLDLLTTITEVVFHIFSKGVSTLFEVEEKALLEIVNRFSRIKEVRSIYVQHYQDEICVYVLLSISQYNEKLMDKLLGEEYAVRKKYSQLVFEFFYPPTGILEKEDFIHPKARCIYIK